MHLYGENITIFDDTEQPVEDPSYPQENEANTFTRDMLFSHEVREEISEDLIEAQRMTKDRCWISLNAS